MKLGQLNLLLYLFAPCFLGFTRNIVSSVEFVAAGAIVEFLPSLTSALHNGQ
jgi:hypothetical protein